MSDDFLDTLDELPAANAFNCAMCAARGQPADQVGTHSCGHADGGHLHYFCRRCPYKWTVYLDEKAKVSHGV